MKGIVGSTDPGILVACKPKVLALYKQVFRFFGGGNGRAADPEVLDPDAVVVALVSVASLSDVLDLKHIPVPLWTSASAFYAQLQPSWLVEAVDHLLHPEDILSVEGLWKDEVIPLPSNSALVHGYFDVRQSEKLDETVLLKDVIWRFFETPGIRSFSLPEHDKYAKRNRSLGYRQQSTLWSERLLEYSRTGQLDRMRLLRASLWAVAASKKAAETRWFADFHCSLAPSKCEMGVLQDAYASLLGSQERTKFALGKKFAVSRSGR